MTESDKNIGLRIKKLREDMGLSQEELGAMMTPTATKQKIYKLEKGLNKVTANLASQLGSIFKIDPLSLASDGAFFEKDSSENALQNQIELTPEIMMSILQVIVPYIARDFERDERLRDILQFNSPSRIWEPSGDLLYSCIKFIEVGGDPTQLKPFIMAAASKKMKN